MSAQAEAIAPRYQRYWLLHELLQAQARGDRKERKRLQRKLLELRRSRKNESRRNVDTVAG
jgi:hypothetical protein